MNKGLRRKLSPAAFILAAVALLAIPILRGGKKLLMDKIPETEA